MKKVLAFAALFQLFSVVSNAQAIKTSITCTVNGGNEKSIVSLYQVKNGEHVKVGQIKLDDKKSAVFNLDLKKEGIYYLGSAIDHGRFFKDGIYVKAGNRLTVNCFLGGKSMVFDFDSCTVVKPNAETKALQAWMNKFTQFNTNRLKDKQFDFYTNYAALEKNASSLMKSKTPNAYFNALLNDKINTELHFLKAGYFFRFNVSSKVLTYDSSIVVKPFYKSLNDTKILNTSAVLHSEHGQEMLKYLLSYWNFKKGVRPTSPFDNTNLIANDMVKAYYLVKYMKPITTYEEFTKNIKPYKNLFNTNELKAIYNKKNDELTKYAKGVPGLDFSLNDVNEKTYTLASFKGKVVVIDLWATWCIPCRRDRPFFMKVEEEYHGRNDIVFVGISQNKIKEKDSWKKFVKDNNYNGVELLDYENKFTDYYNLEGIPRYIIYDRNGKVFTADAPRPDMPEFKMVIEAALASK